MARVHVHALAEAGSAVTTELESHSVANGANPAVIRLEDLSEVLQMPHLLILYFHSANEITSQNRAAASGRTGLAPQQLDPAQPVCVWAPSVPCQLQNNACPCLDLLHRKPRINSQLVAQQVAQQYPMPPPPKKERRERSERTDKDRADGEGERTHGEGRPEVERPERVRSEGDAPEKEKCDKEQPIQEKHGTEKDISPAITKKPGNKKSRSDRVCAAAATPTPSPCGGGVAPPAVLLFSRLCLFSHRPKSEHHQSPPSDKHSIQSGKSATKTNKNSHISRCVPPSL